MKKAHLRIFLFLLAFALIPACQGVNLGDDDDDDSTPTGDDDQTPVDDTYQVDVSSGVVYQSLSTGSSVSVSDPLDSTDWDIRFDGTTLNLNGGESGSGAAWGFGPVAVGEGEYDEITSLDDVYIQFEFTDEFESAMTDWYVYGDQHKINSAYHVYALEVPTDSGGELYKIQILSYYADVNGSPTSAMITFRSAGLNDELSSEDTTVLLDATAGGAHPVPNDPDDKYTYYSLNPPGVVELTDEEAESNEEWDFAFKRYHVKLNGGVSGPKGVLGADLNADVEGALESEDAFAEFNSASSASLTDVTWVEDSIGSIIQDSFVEGDDGLEPSGYVYVIAGADGSSHYKFLVTGLEQNGGAVSSIRYRATTIY